MVARVDDDFLQALRADRPRRSAAGAPWFDRLRSNALERANAASVPSMRDEDWRFTDLRPLTRLSFQPVSTPADVGIDALRPWLLSDAAARLVFVDGMFSPELSVVAPAHGRAYAQDLGTALRERPASIEAHLARAAGIEQNLFVALNTAFLRDAAVIELPAEHELCGPVHVLHVATRRDVAHAIYPRTLLIAGAGSRGTVVEDFVALGPGEYFSAPVTEMVLAANASVEHIRLQRESKEAFQIATCSVLQSANSSYRAVSASIGGRIARLDHDIAHTAPGCETQLSGLMLIGSSQLADTHSFVDHAHPHGRLRQLQKCIVGDRAHAVFNGKVLVREGAFQTDAAQSFRALLLSDRAHIDAKPQLEIFADDVKCAHGAAIGQLDSEELFYLRSRGLSAASAHNLLTYAFAAEVIERISVKPLAAALAETVMANTQETV